MYLESILKKFNLSLKNVYQNFIDGQWTDSSNTYEKKTPITGETIYRAQRSQVSDIDHAVQTAKRAARNWEKQSATQRANLLYKIATIIEQNKLLLASAESLDSGKVFKEALYEVAGAAEQFRYFAACISVQEGSHSQANNFTFLHIKEPLGVVGLIIPWNYPLLLASWKIAPALAAGNALVVKPSEHSALSLLLLTELIKNIIPKGVLNIVTGFGSEAGQALAEHSEVNKISFTGGTSTGEAILQSTAKNIIHTDVELGGKSPQLFFDDIVTNKKTLEKALAGFLSFTTNQGQTCACLSRALVHKNIYDEFIENALIKINKLEIGDPFNNKNVLGPLISDTHLNKVLNYVEIGRSEGAKCLSGGQRKILTGSFTNGSYMEPTILTGTNNLKVFQEEIFGPVLCVTSFANEDEAIEIANDSAYGLAAALWTNDIRRAHRVAKHITAGRIWVNCASVYPVHAAFGGVKKSGFGKSSHKMALDQYQVTKNIIIDNE